MLLYRTIVVTLILGSSATPFLGLVPFNANPPQYSNIVEDDKTGVPHSQLNSIKANIPSTSTNLSTGIQLSKTPAAKRQEIVEDEATICAVRACPPRFGGIIVNGVCECKQLVGRPLIKPSTTPSVKRQEIVQEDEAHICAVRVCPPRFGGVLVDGVCECTQLVGLRPATTLSKPTATPIFKRQELFEEDEAHICAVRVCPPRFGGVLVNGECECTQLVGLRPTATLSSTTKPTDTPAVKREEILEDEAIICAVRVCPPRFGAIIVDGVCTCTRFGLPPPTTPVKRSPDISKYKDCKKLCPYGYSGKRIGVYCKCIYTWVDHPLFRHTVITKREDVDNCLARTCPPRFFSAPDGKGGCDCVQGTKFAPPTA